MIYEILLDIQPVFPREKFNISFCNYRLKPVVVCVVYELQTACEIANELCNKMLKDRSFIIIRAVEREITFCDNLFLKK